METFSFSSDHFRETEYYKKSLVLLRNYAPIENSIGRPIQGSSINLGDFDNNVVDGLNAKVGSFLHPPPRHLFKTIALLYPLQKKALNIVTLQIV